MRIRLARHFLLLGIAGTATTIAQTVSEGTAIVPIVAEDLIAARGTAYRLACMDAIRSTSRVAAEEDKNAAWTEITKNPAAFITKPQVLDEGIREGGKYLVRLSVAVHVDQVQSAVAESNGGSPQQGRETTNPEATTKVVSGERPTVAVVITEKFQTLADAPPSLAPRLEQWLTEQGFVCLNFEQVQLDTIRAQAAAVLRGDVAAATAVASKLKVSWLLVGSVQVTTSAGIDGGDMKQRTATVSLRLVEADSAGVIATAEASGSCPEIDEVRGGREAMRRAADKLVPALTQGINRFLAGRHPLAGRMVVRIFGVLADSDQKLDEVAEIERIVGQIADVSPNGVKILSFANALLELEVHKAKLSTAAFAAELTKRRVTGGRLALIESQPRLLTMQLRAGPSSTEGGGTKPSTRVGELGEQVTRLEFKPIDMARVRASNEELRQAMQKRVASMTANDAQRREWVALRKTLEDAEGQLFRAEKARRGAAEQLALEQKHLSEMQSQLARLTNERGKEKAAASELAQEVHDKEQALALLVRDADQAQREVGERQAQLAGIRDRIQSYES